MINLAILIALIGRPPELDGLATFYNGPGPYTRSGEIFHLDMPICAVDASEWDMLEGMTLLIVSDDGHVSALRVADTGYLYAAGEFKRSTLNSRLFSPSDYPNVGGPAYSVVVDIPRLAFMTVFHDTETRHVWAWVIREEGNAKP